MFLKLRKLMGQPEEENKEKQPEKNNDVLQTVLPVETENRTNGNSRNGTEPAKELLPLIDRVTELVNSSIPDFLQPFIDRDAETKEIYNRLSGPLEKYVKILSEKTEAECKAKTAGSLDSLTRQVATLTGRLRETENQKEEIRNLQLSSERQKRAYTERIHELETQINSSESRREQWEKEKQELKELLKQSEEKVKRYQEELTETREEKSEWEQKQKEFGELIDGFSAKEEEWKKNIESATAEIHNLNEQVSAFTEQEKVLSDALQTARSENSEKDLYLQKQTERITELESRLQTLQENGENEKAERERLLDSRTKQIEELQTRLAAVEESRVTLQQAIEERTKEAETSRTALTENETLRNTLNELQQQLEKKTAECKSLEQQTGILSQETVALKDISEKSATALEATLKREKEWLEEKQRFEADKLHLEQQLREETEQTVALRRQVEEMTADRELQLRQWQETEAAIQAAAEREETIQSSLKTLKEERSALLRRTKEAEEKSGQLERKLEETLNEQNASELLKTELEKIRTEKENTEKALKQAQATCAELMNKTAEQNTRLQQALRENSEAEKEPGEITRLQHELLVVNDMLTALKNQRQNLLQTIEKENAEKKNLRQYISGLENTLKQTEEKLKEYRNRTVEPEKTKNDIAAQSAEKGKFRKHPTTTTEPEEDWLVHPQPDTPEMIEKKKAAKKAAEQPEPEPEKIENKPDPSQMSLW